MPSGASRDLQGLFSAGLYVHKHGLTTYRGQWVQDHGGIMWGQCGQGAWKQQMRWRQPREIDAGAVKLGA